MKKTICIILSVLLLLTVFAPAFSAYAPSSPFELITSTATVDGGHKTYTWTDGSGNQVNPFRSSGSSNKLNPKLKAASLPSKYDLRDVGGRAMVTGVSDQGFSSSCWAFAGIGAIESAAIKQGLADSSVNYSESHLIWFAMKGLTQNTEDGAYGDGMDSDYPFDEGGSWCDVVSTVTRGSGLANDADYPFDPEDYTEITVNGVPHCETHNGNFPESARYVSEMFIKDTMVYTEDADAETIKNFIYEHGAITMGIYFSFNLINQDNWAYYTGVKHIPNHDVLCVGWDDNYSRNNFGTLLGGKPRRDGAWLCRNSYAPGDDWSEDGYFWVSYQTATLGPWSGYTVMPAGEFDNIYQYNSYNNLDYVVANDSNTIDFGNVYTAKGHEQLKAVSFFTLQENCTCTVRVYSDVDASKGSPIKGAIVNSATATCDLPTAGYHTVFLSNPVELSPGENWSAVVTLTANDESYVAANVEGQPQYDGVSYTSKTGQSFVGIDNVWYDSTDVIGDNMNNVVLKAFTCGIPEPTGTAVSVSTKAIVTGQSAALSLSNLPSGAAVSWSSSDESVATVDGSGVVTAVSEGAAVITASVTAGGRTKTYGCTVTVVAPQLDPDEHPADEGMSLWERILAFFRRLIEFIRNLF